MEQDEDVEEEGVSSEASEKQQAILRGISRFRAAEEEVPGAWQAKRELASSVRLLLDCICATDATEEDLRGSANEIRAMAERFADRPVMTDPPGIAEMALSGMETFHDRSPLVGQSNPLAPPLYLSPDPDTGRVGGTGFFGHAYEGAPGCVHGGFIAAAFDELLGMACIFSGNPGMTGTLEIRYVSPTPVRAELRFEGSFDRCEGRKIYTTGSVFAGEVLCATAKGLFISITGEKFKSLNEARRERLGSDG